MAIADQIKESVAAALRARGLNVTAADVALTIPPVKEHGDFSTNAALKSAKLLQLKPMQLAQDLVPELESSEVERVEAVAPGFLNFFMSQSDMASVVKKVLDEGSDFGSSPANGIKVDLEYVSANPTGYLHLGHARGAAVGDSLARIMRKAGYDVTREYYINDAGNQIDHMAESLIARYLQRLGHTEVEVPEDGYHGKDIVDIAEELYQDCGHEFENDAHDHLEFFRVYGTRKLLAKIIDDLKRFGVEFDVFTSEKEIRRSGKVDAVLRALDRCTYQDGGALFLRTIHDGDDKDRCIVKSDGSYTYFLPDIAYHHDKFQRGFDKLIDVFGADHAGYVARLKSAMKSLGHNPKDLQICLVQIVRLFKGGEEYRMSKRTGNAVAMNDLVAEVGVDAVRYFFVSRAGESHLDFDLDLAESLSSSNPVYYAQYTHARLCSALERGRHYRSSNFDASLLNSDSELAIMKTMRDYGSRVKEAADTYEPYKICLFVQNFAALVNEWYQKTRIINLDDEALTAARLALAQACRTILADALNLIGVRAPVRM